MTRQGWLPLGLLAALFCSAVSHAAPPKQIDVTPATPAGLSQTWAGGAAASFSQAFCVTSQNTNNGAAVTYNLKATASGSATQFILNGSTTTLPFTATWNGSALTAGVALTAIPGTNLPCPGTDNGTLLLQFTQANLLAVPVGTYTTTLTLLFYNVANGNNKSQTVTLSISLTIPNLIQVSQLANLNLGTFNGSSGMAGSTSMCIYRNSPGTYAVTVNGQGTGSAYVAVNGSNQVPLALTWNDGTGAQPLTPGTPLTGRSNVNLTSTTCTTNNATLGASATSANLLAAKAGSYLGTVTITVLPQ